MLLGPVTSHLNNIYLISIFDIKSTVLCIRTFFWILPEQSQILKPQMEQLWIKEWQDSDLLRLRSLRWENDDCGSKYRCTRSEHVRLQLVLRDPRLDWGRGGKGGRTAQSGCAGPGSGINTLSSVRTFLAHETEVFEEFSLYLYTENNKMDFPVNCWKFENELDIWWCK